MTSARGHEQCERLMAGMSSPDVASFNRYRDNVGRGVRLVHVRGVHCHFSQPNPNPSVSVRLIQGFSSTVGPTGLSLIGYIPT